MAPLVLIWTFLGLKHLLMNERMNTTFLLHLCSNIGYVEKLWTLHYYFMINIEVSTFHLVFAYGKKMFQTNPESAMVIPLRKMNHASMPL